MRFLAIISIAFVLACNSDDSFSDLPENAEDIKSSELVGKWVLEATRISPGGVVDWTEDNSGSNIIFDLNRSFIWDYNNGTDPLEGTFAVEDNLLSLTYPDNLGGEIERQYYLSIEGSIFQINYIGCIESCTLQFRRQ
ncbi:lipocalin family protein [Poritiphilus flavus]|uniref:Lipocalin-like domain-containing protein n=1 Tax=Poritiphilus flavus TaxID=2697053 RepID=A0A6L9EAK2_9FLAO|nr:lipocalin family protein [Poritiphilus flavus]NAS11571.1 hypothetical protein [Poritiphilus flavus]